MNFKNEDLLAVINKFSFGDEFKDEIDRKISLGPNDSTMYLHVYVVRAGTHPDPLVTPFDPTNSIYRRYPLLRKMKAPSEKVKLLEQAPKSKGDDKKEEVISYWYPDLYLELVNHDSPLNPFAMPVSFRNYFYVDPGTKQYYHPVIYVNEIWEIRSNRIPISGHESKELPLKIHLSTTSLFKFQICTHLNYSIKQQEAAYGEHQEFDDIKRMFLETPSWLLIVTFVVSSLHMLFEFLAFKNDVQFWRKQDDLRGISVRSVLINILFQIIIFMYLLDNETSKVVLLSAIIGLVIEVWKLSRAFSICWVRSKYIPVIYVPVLLDRSSYAQSRTKEYDEAALKYLTIASLPVLLAYSAYTLMFKEYKSWNSWVIGSLVGFVYTFGFISMMPQLFINYKLKSVAQMPWKAFTYKALNTFIDDLFAFVIKMPWMHRIACFRDDVLFLVYLYQLWIYPVDLKRANEFGQTFQKDCNESSQEKDLMDEGSKPPAMESEEKTLRKRKLKAAKSS